MLSWHYNHYNILKLKNFRQKSDNLSLTHVHTRFIHTWNSFWRLNKSAMKKPPVKSRPSNFIFEKRTSEQSGQIQILIALLHLVNPLYHSRSSSATSFGDWAGTFVSKILLGIFLLHKFIVVGPLDLNDKNLSKLWMDPINWNTYLE